MAIEAFATSPQFDFGYHVTLLVAKILQREFLRRGSCLPTRLQTFYEGLG